MEWLLEVADVLGLVSDWTRGNEGSMLTPSMEQLVSVPSSTASSQLCDLRPVTGPPRDSPSLL